MTKLQEFLISFSNCRTDAELGVPNYEEMTEEKKQIIDNLKKAVDDACRVFAKYE